MAFTVTMYIWIRHVRFPVVHPSVWHHPLMPPLVKMLWGERRGDRVNRKKSINPSMASIGADVNPRRRRPSMPKPKKLPKPLNDLSRSLTPFDPNETLTVVIEQKK